MKEAGLHVKDQKVSSQQFPVVGIGASAGGLEAFKSLVSSIPEKSGMAYVLVQHLNPSQESNLVEILQKSTKIPVEQIQDNVHLKPDCIYVIPPGRMLTTVDSMLNLEPIQNRKIKTIDRFFSSLGVVHKEFAVGVVLSGSLNDGTLGLQVIKSHGGITFAQDEEAAFDSMPVNAVKSGAVDFRLPADQIIPKLIEINHPFHSDNVKSDVKKQEFQDDDQVYKQLLTVIRIRKGVDFLNYKQSTLKRRIIRRMALNKITNTHAYLNFLRDNKNEQDALYDDLLISVTSFFRDKKSFEFLSGTIFPALLDQRAVEEPLRIWVAGCATGEEAYSMAICLQEYLGIKAAERKIQVFATDISETAIAKARSGIFRPSDMEGVSPLILQKYFDQVEGNFQIKDSIRQMCVFANHNLLKDPPFSKIDLVSCRNVLIYFEPVLQKRVLSTFHYALNEGGYLMLGKSETIGVSTDLFVALNTQEKFYQSKGAHGRYRSTATVRNEQTMDSDPDVQDKKGIKDGHKIADALLLSKYAPAAVMVNQSYDVIELRGQTEPWLTLPSGKASLSILKMCREGLSFEVRNLLQLAKTKQTAVNKENITFKNEGQQYVNIEVIPLAATLETYFLIVFQRSNGFDLQAAMGFNALSGESNMLNDPRYEQLETELIQTREDMRGIIEVQEAANEELQSANEELLSGNEELQSLNEELETSKEELQSSNEEISIVNKELLERNQQLNNSRKYTEEIFNTIYDPLIILDKDLRVLRATEGFYQTFKVHASETEGKYLYDLGNKQWDIPVLRKQLDALPTIGSFKSLEVDHVFNSIGRRVMNLTASQFVNHSHESLILLAVHDITDKRKVEEGLAEVERLLEESRERLSLAIDSAGIGTWDFNPKTGELVWDSRCRALFGLDARDDINPSVFLEQIHPDDRKRTDDIIQRTLTEKNDKKFEAEFRTIGRDKKVRWIKSKGKAYFDEDNRASRFVGTVLDISVEKVFEEHTKALLQKKDEFLSIASHELKTPITSLKAIVQILARSVSQKEDQKLRTFAEKAGKQVDKLSDLITDLLDVTKIQAGQLELNKSDFSMTKLIHECCEQLPERSEHNVINVTGSEEILVHADKNRIEQVIMNLINNAVKYAPLSNLIKIQVSKAHHEVKVSVTDFGIGVDKDKFPFLFERFFRVEESAKSFTGLGLGLYISSEIVKRHEGDIGIESEPGKGSTFWFTIPDKA